METNEIDIIRKKIHRLEKVIEGRLSVPKGFFVKLLNEDDWSFIIKLHALIEGAVSCLLTKSVGDGCLGDVFSRIELSNNKTGKIAFVKSLGLLTEDERKFIEKLSKMRNKLIHNISKISFNLKSYIGELDNNQIKQLIEIFFYWNASMTKEDKIDFTKQNPKVVIWLGTLIILDHVYIER